MQYRYHDGVVLRWAGLGSEIELNVRGDWKPFPEAAGGDIRQSADAAWLEGTSITEARAKALIKEKT